MTAVSVLSALAVAGIAAASDYGLFAAAWVAAGIASAGLYYPPAFAALTTWYEPRRIAALTTLTLVAGFASTIFAPAHLGARPGRSPGGSATGGRRAGSASAAGPWPSSQPVPRSRCCSGCCQGRPRFSSRHRCWRARSAVFNAPLTAAGAMAPSIGAAIAAAVGRQAEAQGDNVPKRLTLSGRLGRAVTRLAHPAPGEPPGARGAARGARRAG
jgi:hypothetical protein